MKKILFLAFTILTASCSPNTEIQDKKVTTGTNIIKISDKQLAETKVSLALDNFPDAPGNVSDKDKENVGTFLKDNDIFKLIPYTSAEKYLVRFTQDGGPAFFTGDGGAALFTGDGGPALSVKAANSVSDLTWSRKEGQQLFDHYQVTNTIEKSWGITNYARYSQIIENNISVSGAASNEKKIEMVKSMGFGLVKNGDKFELQSVTPIAIRRTSRDKMAYHILNIVFTSAKNKLILAGYRKLIPLPGISISRHLGSHKVKVQLQVRLINENTEFAAILSIKDKQFQLYKIAGNIYGGEVELPVLTAPDTMVIEFIDKDSLVKNEDYNGYTFMFPVTD